MCELCEAREPDLEILSTPDGTSLTFHSQGPHASQRPTGPGADVYIRYSIGDANGSPLLRYLMNGRL